MLIAYYSLTGNVRSFVERTGYPSIEIHPDVSANIEEPFLLIVPSYVGYVNNEVMEFLDENDNYKHLVGTVGSGNINFGDLYCVNAKELATHYHVPFVFGFEYQGTDHDLQKFKKEVEKLATTNHTNQ